ncbi:alpha/beta fold hydrolase [Micromonospora radicis]|uniref:Alpha/beta fold hydrolase n=1 Tax=Micromonospora radicis TaxID=1894971 RepID=A0A418MWH1_9ACTN|nr:alpha/beta fold hydrolase [Micromonospora radicis]RIV39223.1 alpha/beta fold hydrolase [Micromonospora radicis]
MTDPEIGRTLRHGPFTTNYHDAGDGEVVLLIHGSGPGVTAWANWRLVLPELSRTHRVLAPDVAGFGYTETSGDEHGLDVWLRHLTSFLDELAVERVRVVGNSFGGALALWFAVTHPHRVERIVLMGSVGTEFPLTAGLDAVWGYEPSVEAMEELLTYFVHDRSALPPSLAEQRYRASTKPGAQERWAAMFPAPRQRWIDELAVSRSRLATLRQPTLLVHGREDQVIPLESSLRLLDAIDDATLHVFPHTGHWVQIERADEFTRLVVDFLGGRAAGGAATERAGTVGGDRDR